MQFKTLNSLWNFNICWPIFAIKWFILLFLFRMLTLISDNFRSCKSPYLLMNKIWRNDTKNISSEKRLEIMHRLFFNSIHFRNNMKEFRILIITTNRSVYQYDSTVYVFDSFIVHVYVEGVDRDGFGHAIYSDSIFIKQDFRFSKKWCKLNLSVQIHTVTYSESEPSLTANLNTKILKIHMHDKAALLEFRNK